MQDFPEANILATKLLMDVKTTYARIYIRLVDEDNSHLGKTCISFIAVLYCIIVKISKWDVQTASQTLLGTLPLLTSYFGESAHILLCPPF